MPLSLEVTLAADRAGHITFDTSSIVKESQLSGRKIVVTGGASGIGEACCRKLVSAGAYVVIADQNEKLGLALQYELAAKTDQSKVKFVPVDISSWESQLSLFAAALDFFPGHEMTTLITCAGVVSSSSWNIVPENSSALRAPNNTRPPPPSTTCLDVNLIGTMYSVKIATTYCMGAGVRESSEDRTEDMSRSIILMGSTAGFRPLAGKTDYSVAKWGVRGFFRNIRTELSRYGIRVNLLAPFWVPTPLTESQVPELEKLGFRIAKLEDAIDGIVRMILDTSMNGRAVGVVAEGLIDLCDDTAGMDGGDMMLRIVQRGLLPPSKSATLPESGS